MHFPGFRSIATQTPLTDKTGTVIGWQYNTADGDLTETYDTQGRLLSIANRAGLAQTLSYDAQQRLTMVTDPFGRQITLTYDSDNRIATMTDPAGQVYTYAYTAQHNLTMVTYPDGKTRIYHYEDTRFLYTLTGITDENGARFATYAYDGHSRASLSQHAGGAGKATLVYNTDGTTTVTDALNTFRTYTFTKIEGKTNNTGISQPCNTCGTALSS